MVGIGDDETPIGDRCEDGESDSRENRGAMSAKRIPPKTRISLTVRRRERGTDIGQLVRVSKWTGFVATPGQGYRDRGFARLTLIAVTYSRRRPLRRYSAGFSAQTAWIWVSRF